MGKIKLRDTKYDDTTEKVEPADLSKILSADAQDEIELARHREENSANNGPTRSSHFDDALAKLPPQKAPVFVGVCATSGCGADVSPPREICQPCEDYARRKIFQKTNGSKRQWDYTLPKLKAALGIMVGDLGRGPRTGRSARFLHGQSRGPAANPRGE